MMFMLRAHHRQQRDFGWVQTAHCIPLLEAAELLMCYYGGTRLYQHQYLLGLAQYGFYLRWLNSISSPCFVTFLCFLCFSFSPGFKLLTSLNDKYQIIEIARRIFRHWLRLKYQGLGTLCIENALFRRGRQSCKARVMVLSVIKPSNSLKIHIP